MSEIDRILKCFEAKSKHFEEAEKRQLEFWESGGGPLPLLLMTDATHDMGTFNSKEIHYDSEKMFISEVLKALRALNGGGEAVPSVRANMGCSVYPSLLGVAPQLFEDKMPWVTEHLTREQIVAIKPESIKISGDFKTAIKHMSYMKSRLGNSPIRIYPPDLQGPFDMAHIVYGDAIFYDMYDDPTLVHYLLDLCCHAIILGFEASMAVIPDSEELVAHYNNLVIPRSKGGLKISEDTSTLLSRDAIDEFVVPYTRRILDYFGGGYIHYCGKNNHLFEAMLELDKAHGINFGNPEMHDMDEILGKIAKADMIYYGAINQLPGETERDFFLRVRKASDDKLLLVKDVGSRDASEILRIWRGI